MKVDEVIAYDNINITLDDDVVDILRAMGFVQLDIAFAPVPKGWACVVTGTRADGTQEVWVSPRAFKTPQGAHNGAIAAISTWILSQPIPATP